MHPHPAEVDAALAHLMDWPAWTARRAAVRWPHVVDLRRGPARLVLLGVPHTHDPSSPLLAQIAEVFRALRPTLVYAEGGRPTPLGAVEASVGAYGEAGLLAELCRRARVPLRTLEPWRQDEARRLWPALGRERTKLFYVLRDLDTWHRGHRAVPIEAHAGVLLDNLSRGGVCGPPVTVRELAPVARAHLPTLDDWRATPSTWFDPAVPTDDPWTHAAARRSSRIRDEVAVRRLAAAVARGQRVLAVVGFTHSVMQAPVWRALGAQERGGLDGA